VSLRIIAGEFRGRRIQAPQGRDTRPTREVVREAWFNVLGDRISGARVLDLYAGSGALGLEALSRGAAFVGFVESSPAALAVLRANVETLSVGSRTAVLARDVRSVVRGLSRAESRDWDVVLADPPYAGEAASKLVSDFDRTPFADILCVEHARDVDFAREPDWRRSYGETALSVFLDPTEGATDG
jgi:16S rRNA (guanine966-N2)-methyltransferase